MTYQGQVPSFTLLPANSCQHCKSFMLPFHNFTLFFALNRLQNRYSPVQIRMPPPLFDNEIPHRIFDPEREIATAQKSFRLDDELVVPPFLQRELDVLPEYITRLA